MDPALEKLKEHLVAKNVAIEIATKLCDSVSSKLEGKVYFFFWWQYNYKNFLFHDRIYLLRFLVHLNQ